MAKEGQKATGGGHKSTELTFHLSPKLFIFPPMKKQYLSFGLLLFFLGFSISSYGQNVSINRPIGGDNAKSVSQARSIALTNTALSVGAGIGAVALSDNSTIETAGAILGVYGIVIGPSTGHFYAEDYPRGVIGMGARAIGAVLMVDATSEIFGRDFADALGVDDKDVSLTDTKVLIGEVLVLGSIVYNLISIKASVEEFNSGQNQFGLNVTPTVVNDKVAPVLTASFNF
jgi:hypothetical protein